MAVRSCIRPVVVAVFRRFARFFFCSILKNDARKIRIFRKYGISTVVSMRMGKVRDVHMERREWAGRKSIFLSVLLLAL